MRKTSEETVQFVVELLLSGYTPDQISECKEAGVSVATAQRIAKREGLAAGRGRRPHHDEKPRKAGGIRADAARLLRQQGYTMQQIAEALALTRQRVSQILDEGDKKIAQ